VHLVAPKCFDLALQALIAGFLCEQDEWGLAKTIAQREVHQRPITRCEDKPHLFIQAFEHMINPIASSLHLVLPVAGISDIVLPSHCTPRLSKLHFGNLQENSVQA